jgi:hypothetical protein
LEVLDQRRFWDLPPAQVWAWLLDEGTSLASISTMYRLVRQAGEHPRPAPPAHPPGPGQAAAAGRQAKRGVVVGYHQAGWPEQA